tara:strand:+ start:259 stop:678 length:420 start_codon:yes stop_codon:yes gene_type:complete
MKDIVKLLKDAWDNKIYGPNIEEAAGGISYKFYLATVDKILELCKDDKYEEARDMACRMTFPYHEDPDIDKNLYMLISDLLMAINDMEGTVKGEQYTNFENEGIVRWKSAEQITYRKLRKAPKHKKKNRGRSKRRCGKK